MEQFNITFDANAKNYVVVIIPKEEDGKQLFTAIIDEDRKVEFEKQKDGSLDVTNNPKLETNVINSIATRILEQVNLEDRNNHPWNG